MYRSPRRDDITRHNAGASPRRDETGRRTSRTIPPWQTADRLRAAEASSSKGSGMLKLYGFAKVNPVARGNTRDLRVLWALEEMQLPFELVGMDHPAHDLNTPAYRALNPFEQIPTIEDDGLVLTESAAIVVYLAKKSGKLIPADLAGEAQVLRWCFAAMNSLEMPLAHIMMIDWMKDAGCANYRGFLAGWAERMLGGLERRLEGRSWLATDDFSVADLLMAHVLSVIKDARLLEPHPGVLAYRDRCLGRPAWQRTVERYFARVEAG
jgi:glutathione S-transferase